MKTKLFRNLGILVVVSMLFVLPSVVLAADDYPTKPVRLIVPYPPGGAVDLFGRFFAAKLSERLGQQVIVDNRGGGGSVIGTEVAARSAPDGYTLILANLSHTLTAVTRRLPYDAIKSFTAIVRVCSAPNVLIVHPSVPANTLKEFIALAKQKPGQLVFNSSGFGDVSHIWIEHFKTLAGIDCKIVPFKGAGPALVDLLGGHANAFICSLSLALPYAKDGKVRVLGSGGKKRSRLLPDVPTIAEVGFPEFEAFNWYGILAPAGTPESIAARLDREFKVILTLDDVKKWLVTRGAEADYLGRSEFSSFIESDMTKWAGLVKSLNIKLEE